MNPEPFRKLAVESSASDGARRDRLIIVSSASAGGNLRRSGIDAQVDAGWSPLVWGPVPTSVAPPAFRAARLAAWDSDTTTTDQPEPWEREPADPDSPGEWSQHLDRIAEFERIELWVDPEPNAQLLMLQQLDWFARQPGLVERLFMVHANNSIGEQSALQLREMKPSIDNVTEQDIDLASIAWKAWGQTTPEAWFGLLVRDLTCLPNLYRTVELMLRELPAAGTALMATQRRILELIASGVSKPGKVLAGMTRGSDPDCVFGYWQIGRLLDGLARSDPPSVLGLQEGPFTLDLHDDSARHDRYRDSTLSVSDLGRALLAGTDDLARHASINRWWGGTKITNAQLWRWDGPNRTLVSPTGSPNLASPRRPSAARERLKHGRSAANEGRHEEALADYEWFFDHALEESRSLRAVRSSFCLSYWIELGEIYPPAKAALVARRDEKFRAIEAGELNEHLYDDLMSINRALRDNESTYMIFMKVFAMDRTLASSQRWSRGALSSIVYMGNYDVARECIGDPARAFREVAQRIALHRADQCLRPPLPESEKTQIERHLIDRNTRKLQLVLDVVRHVDGQEASTQLLCTASVVLSFDTLGERVLSELKH